MPTVEGTLQPLAYEFRLPTAPDDIEAEHRRYADIHGFTGIVVRSGAAFATFAVKPGLAAAKEIVRRTKKVK